jgi:cobalt-zinc-cadmium efflux system outer membrane protein
MRVPSPPLRRGLSLVAWLLGLCASFATSPSCLASGLTLDEAMQRARAETPRLRAQAARIDAARQDAGRAGQLPDPELQLAVDNLPVSGADAFSLSADDMTMRRIGIMQAWPSRGLREAERADARARVEVVAGETRLAEREVERAAGEAWIAAWVAERERRLLRAEHEAARDALGVGTAGLQSGTVSATDALAAGAAVAELEAQAGMAEARVAAARASLARWLGPAAATEALAEPPGFAELPVARERLLEAMDEHAELAAWDAREREAQAAVAAARARRRPALSWAASYGARSAGRGDMAMLEVSIGLPLFRGRRQDRDLAARLSEADAVAFERDDAARAHREAVQRELAMWQGLRDEGVALRERLAPLAHDRVELARQAYGAGGPVDPWLEARRDELDLRRRQLQTEAALARAWLALATLTVAEGVAP